MQSKALVNKAEIDVFLELSCFFDDPSDVGNLISGSSAFSKTSLNIWKCTVHVLLKPSLENFEHYFQTTAHHTHLTCCLLRNLYAGQEATIRTGHGKQTGSKQEKEYVKGVYGHPPYLTSMQSTS